MAEKPASFTGRSRTRKTRPSVLVANRIARWMITIGGIGTIAAVLGVLVFLVWVVLPLFAEAKIQDFRQLDLGWQKPPVHIAVDEYQLLGWALLPSGEVEVFRLDTGERRALDPLVEGDRLSAFATVQRSDSVLLGYRDGAVAAGRIGFETRVLDLHELPAETQAQLAAAGAGTPVSYLDGVIEHTPQDQFRFQRLHVEIGDDKPITDGPVRVVRSVVRTGGAPLIAAISERPADAGGYRLHLIEGEEESNFLTGEKKLVFGEPIELPFAPPSSDPPRFLELSGDGNDLYVAWEDGSLLRYDIRDAANALVSQKGRLIAPGRALTAFGFILGNTTLVWGDSRGEVHGGFPVRVDERVEGTIPWLEDQPQARSVLVQAKDLAHEGSKVLALAPSERSRLLLIGFEDGQVQLSNVTHASRLTRVRLPVNEPVLALRMSPKEDGLIALTGSRLLHARLDPRYSEASFAGLFQAVWYEGYARPRHLWQSSSASDDFEPKLGLISLIFGTLKATVYSMLFGVPLALLAAIFTSEFLHPKTKSVVKPTIELMASLPSVVLGFLAALVFAPLIENVVPAVLALFFTLPIAFLLGAYAWQLLPQQLTLRWEALRIVGIVLVAPLGVGLALWLGPLLERLLFGGDLKGWLAWVPGQDGAERFASPVGGWVLILAPLAALAVAVASARLVNPRLRHWTAAWERRSAALADGAKFLIGLVATVCLAYLCAELVAALGFDPRGSLIGTYSQRNALVVGFVMGFAIIPIIYTISEDALSTVPEHLRSASLGAGATPWQTAMRIVVPTAMSGLFSAVMIGLGRAVGETMIVLMAAGNTPVLEWNVFEGFRTLSANIAVELPEAVRNSTHYRTLFLAALVLFVITFIVNTIAEIVRLRFRKRAYQL